MGPEKNAFIICSLCSGLSGLNWCKKCHTFLDFVKHQNFESRKFSYSIPTTTIPFAKNNVYSSGPSKLPVLCITEIVVLKHLFF